jgi:uncharacterized protein (TIGR00730 family)
VDDHEVMAQQAERPEQPAAVAGLEPLEPRSRRLAPTRRRLRRRAGSGDRVLDQRIRALVEAAAVAPPELVEDVVMTAFRLARDANRGELKLVSRSLRELARAFRIFGPYRERRKVSLFGSARTRPSDPEYRLTREFALAIVAHGWMVITGAGGGIMAAGHEGAGPAASFGVGIRLPLEAPNTYIAGDPKLIDFKYFFARKIMFMKESDAFVLLPGGFGTLDEAFELLTLMQTGKTALRPVVLLSPAGSSYWAGWRRFVEEHLLQGGLISPEDLALLETAQSVDEAVACLERFYRNYQSARYVGERLVLRLRHAPAPAALERLNDEFADIVARGRIEAIEITPAEARDGDCADLARLAFEARPNFGRIRQLIDALNLLVPEPAESSGLATRFTPRASAD